ncbi:hypothetical protein [Streptomyces sp. NRRL WC-3549]|uniref:hypothetical protein n=1 Tax=Streptomyces sp. NRRL WC-3549 TaxID=1463925 RepID=UPI00068FFE5B|nr:hypothetical protein [Streptomyces sp. NRRL WC-3549]
MVLAALIWSVTLAALAVLGFLVLVVAVWSAASGESPVPFLLGVAGAVVACAVLLSGLYAAPFLRRMPPAGRLALIGALVGPFPVAAVAYVLNG